MAPTDAMSPPPFDLAGELHRHGDALRTLAGQLVRDEHVVDDVVQDVWLAALQRPPRHHDSIGGWLATALRNVVRGWRRKERRRERHETASAVAVAKMNAERARGSREQMARELLGAVAALEPVYRDVVWQRFFEGKPPRAIAEASGVPVATVKSRLQRALGMLRTQFGERERERGGDWRGALAAAFGLREGAVSAGAAGALATGGVFVAMWTKSLVVVTAAALAAIWLWPGESTPASVDAVSSTSNAIEPVAAAPGAAPAPANTPGVGDTPVRELVAAAPVRDPKLAILRGRCVDAAGNAVADCSGKLRGWLGRAPSNEQWLLEHGAAPIELGFEPGSDGRFELRFEPPPPYIFSLSIEGQRWAPAIRNWDSISPGATEDLGDVTLSAGARVRGVVVDGAGIGVSGVVLTLHAVAPDLRLGNPVSHATAVDGAFTFVQSVALGAYTTTAGEEWTVASPEQVLDRAGAIDIRVQVTRPGVAMITGTLVDDAGRAIVDEPVAALGDRDRVVGVAWPRADGSFTLLGNDVDPKQPVRLRAGSPDAFGEPTAPMPWGSRGVTMRLPQPVRADLTVFVGDAEGRPLADCTVRVAAADTTRWSAGSAARLQRTGADGMVTVPRLLPGRYLVVGQFPPSNALRAQVEPIELDGHARRVEIRFGTEASRRIRVVRADGSPVVGTNLQLCEPWPAQRTGMFEVRMSGEWFTSNTSGSMKLLVHECGTTDAQGAVVVHGPRGRALALRVLGPGHIVIEREDLRLDGEGDLVVTVAAGARVRGRVQPSEVLAELRRLAGVAPEGHAERDQRPRIGLRAGGLVLPPSTMTAGTPDLERFVIQEDGSFDLPGLPPGAWDLHVIYPVRSESMTVSQRFPLGTHTLADGSVLDLPADLTPLLPGTIRARVREGGRAVANTTFGLQRAPDGTGGDSVSPTHQVKTDGDGCFEITTRPGRYHLHRAHDDTLVATPTIDLVRGALVEPTLDFAVGTMQVRLLTADGHPAVGVGIHTSKERFAPVRTDADGMATLTLPPGECSLRVLKRALQQREAREGAGVMFGPERAVATDWLDLGKATVIADRNTALELRLPVEWEKVR